MRQNRSIRALRGGAAAALATFVALIGHVAGGGDLPGWLGIVAPLLISATLSMLLVGAALSVVRLTIVVAASQALFHLLFVLGASPGGVASGGHHGVITNTVATTVATAPVGVGTSHQSPAMWLGHAIAVAVTVVALHRGERVLRALRLLAVLLAGAIARAFAAPRAVLVRRIRIVALTRPARARFLLLVAAAPRRGPPALAV